MRWDSAHLNAIKIKSYLNSMSTLNTHNLNSYIFDNMLNILARNNSNLFVVVDFIANIAVEKILSIVLRQEPKLVAHLFLYFFLEVFCLLPI